MWTQPSRCQPRFGSRHVIGRTRRIALAAAVLLSGCASDSSRPAIELPTTAQPITHPMVAGFEKAFAVGHVILAGQPTPVLLANARDAGWSVVINARPSGEMTFDEGALVKGLGMRYVSLPFTPDTLDDALVAAFIAEIRKADGKVLAHCSSGNRVAALWALYEITDLRVPPEEAVARARTAGLKSPELIGFIGEYARRVGAW